MVVIRLHGVLREETGLRELEICGSSLSEVRQRLPEGVREVLAKYSKYLVILINGKAIRELDADLRPGDVIDITIYVSGGCFGV
jgi:molybdopterin converting factor small subunit